MRLRGTCMSFARARFVWGFRHLQPGSLTTGAPGPRKRGVGNAARTRAPAGSGWGLGEDRPTPLAVSGRGRQEADRLCLRSHGSGRCWQDWAPPDRGPRACVPCRLWPEAALSSLPSGRLWIGISAWQLVQESPRAGPSVAPWNPGLVQPQCFSFLWVEARVLVQASLRSGTRQAAVIAGRWRPGQRLGFRLPGGRAEPHPPCAAGPRRLPPRMEDAVGRVRVLAVLSFPTRDFYGTTVIPL